MEAEGQFFILTHEIPTKPFAVIHYFQGCFTLTLTVRLCTLTLQRPSFGINIVLFYVTQASCLSTVWTLQLNWSLSSTVGCRGVQMIQSFPPAKTVGANSGERRRRAGILNLRRLSPKITVILQSKVHVSSVNRWFPLNWLRLLQLKDCEGRKEGIIEGWREGMWWQ